MDSAPIRAFSYDEESIEEGSLERLHDGGSWVGRRRVTWLDVECVDDAEVLASLERDFGIHPLTAEDVRNTRQRPKVERYPGYVYLVAHMPTRVEEGGLDTEQVSILLGDGWVITLQSMPGDVFGSVRSRLRSAGGRLRAGGPDLLAHALLDAIVDAYFPLLDELGARAEDLEERVLEQATPGTRERIQALRRELLTLRHVAYPQRAMLAELERGDLPQFSPETRTYLRDVTDHATRVLEFVETNRELVHSIMDLYAAGVAQRTNETMKVLTLVATVFIPLTFLVGVWGMNFDYMPELRWRYGYAVSLAFMGLIGGAMYVAFRRMRWL